MSPIHSMGEDLINRSLLDSIDSPSDLMGGHHSEQDFSPFVATTDSIAATYRASQAQPQPRAESPPTHHNTGVPPVTDAYLSKKHVMSNALYGPLHSPEIHEHDPTRVGINGFSGAPYRAGAAFAAYPNARPRQNTAPAGGGIRDAFSQAYSPQTDIYGTNGPGPAPQALQHGDPIAASARQYDFDPNSSIQAKYFANLSIGHDGRYAASTGVLPPGPAPKSMPPQQPPQHQYVPGPGHVNGLHVAGPPQYSGHGQGAQAPPQPLQPAPPVQQEEICTIFVVGFPDDMQEREFQNMFTFSADFEAATLKIPNKDMNGYSASSTQQSATATRPATFPSNSFSPSVATAGAYPTDSFTGELPAAWTTPQGEDSFPRNGQTNAPEQGLHIAQMPTMPPRKQIIGFAKFKTRTAAMDARDCLQGKRVDVEKGAVLKAEMAKKNLHTKRGVGPLPASVPSTGTVGPETLASLAGMNGLLSSQPLGNGEALAQRERELGALGVMGLAPVSQRVRDRERDDDEKARRGSQGLSIGLSDISRTREDEERERRRKEKDMQKPRMSAYDAFHSIPAPPAPAIARPSQGGTAAGVDPGPLAAFTYNNGHGPVSLTPTLHSFSSQDVFAIGSSATWGKPPDRFSLSKASTVNSLPARPSSPSQYISPDADGALTTMPPSSSSSVRTDGSASSPPATTLPLQLPHPVSSRSYSPPNAFEGPLSSADTHSMPTSSSSSVVDSDGEIPRAMAALNMSTHNGMTSPQLPSPASGGSSTTTSMRINGTDQNPPINTLYVGNLPTSPPPNFPPNHLEDNLRSLFSRCPGYRKLCFRQKSNGPMCFVEFDDVTFAAKAIAEMYGDTLNGLVKTGIRLSYSKNPLGVRTSASAQGLGRPDNIHPTQIGLQEALQQSRHMQTNSTSDTNHTRPRDDSRAANQFDYGSSPSRFFPSPPAMRTSFNPGAPIPATTGGLSRTNVPPQAPPLLSPPLGNGSAHEPLDDRLAGRDSVASFNASPGLEMATG